MPKNKTLYICGVYWQHEIGEAIDLEGDMPFFSSIEELKNKYKCWKQCGILQIEAKEVNWVEPQNLLFSEGITDEKN